jgi:branched-chain amino acid transport system substrate-binding protein
VLEVQFRNINNNELDQFKDRRNVVILWPDKYKTGDVVYPYTDVPR